MMLCKLIDAFDENEYGTYPFDVVPHVNDSIVLPNGKGLDVHYVVHVLVDMQSAGLRHEVVLGVRPDPRGS